MVMLPYPISANRYWRNFRGRMVVSSEAKAYKAKVIWTFEALEIIPTFLPVELSMKLHPKLTTKGKASRTLIDLDNCIKVCLDALQGALYMNESAGLSAQRASRICLIRWLQFISASLTRNNLGRA